MAILFQYASSNNQYDRIHHVNSGYQVWIALAAFGILCLYFVRRYVSNWNYEIRAGTRELAFGLPGRLVRVPYEDVKRVVAHEM